MHDSDTHDTNAASSGNAFDASAAIARGLAHHHAGRLADAKAVYENVLARAPGHPAATHLLGMVAFQSNDAARALELVQRAIAAEPGNADFRHDLGDVLLAQDRVDDAIACYGAALSLDASHADARFGMGRALHRRGDVAAAVAHFEQALASRPRFAAALAHLGMALHQQGRLDDAIARYRAAAEAEPRAADIWFNLGNALKDHGELDEAVRAYERAIALAPRHAFAHNNLGAVLQQRGDRDAALASYRRALALQPQYAPAATNAAWLLHAQGHDADAITVLEGLLARDARQPAAWLALGRLQQHAGAWDRAGACFHQAATLAPGNADAHNALGHVLAHAGHLDAAIARFRQAIALAPRLAEAHNNLGSALLATGDPREALASYRTALACADTDEIRANVARALRVVPPAPGDADVATLLARALREAWVRPADLVRTATTLLLADPGVRALVARVPAGAAMQVSEMLPLARNLLLREVLHSAPVTDVTLEQVLAAARRALLGLALRAVPREDGASTGGEGAQRAGPHDAVEVALARFACSVARQCFLDEYVLAAEEAEEAEAAILQRSVQSTLREERPVSPLALATAAAYAPLWRMGVAADALRAAARTPGDAALAEDIDALVRQQVDAPAREALIAGRLPRLTPIVDAAAHAVQAQYEANPYPRWVKAPPATGQRTLPGRLRELMPHMAPLPAGAFTRLLIAGCGTGQEAVETARQYPDASILAIDVSLASLGYAARQAEDHGVGNVEFVQADLTALPGKGLTFDVISSVGVLHHLADPAAGLAALATCLRPGGLMQIGLYSRAARRAIRQVRALLAGEGQAAVAAGIPAARQWLLAHQADPAVGTVAGMADFYTASGFRDLLLHAQEHEFSLPEIDDLVRGAGLEVMGLVVDPPVARDYAAGEGAGDARQADLRRWAAYEATHPDTFLNMVVLWARRP